MYRFTSGHSVGWIQISNRFRPSSARLARSACCRSRFVFPMAHRVPVTGNGVNSHLRGVQ